VLIDRASLSGTVDAINAALFEGRALAAAERQEAARWIAARQGLPGSYGGTFAAFPPERSDGIVLFTGERLTSASARHVIGEEASRALRLLRVRDRDVARALTAADDAMMRCVEREARHARNDNPGLYCCARCSVGLWRNLLSGGLDRREERLVCGVRHLHAVRDERHGWRRFPFWYTVLALSELDHAEARRELAHAAPALERVARRAVPRTVYARRRRDLAVRTLDAL
jgi:hypothetical protein